MASCRLLVHSAQQVVPVAQNGERMLRGKDMDSPVVLNARQDEGLSVVVDSKGRIADVGYDSEIREKFLNISFDRTIDASGMCVLPGLVDAHTHSVWAGDRVHEFAMKLAGATYMEVHQAGGGIHFTVEHTRQATEDELFQSLRRRLMLMLRAGTSLVECKSGYGLDTETEIKMLRVIERARKEVPIDISSTFCGAHAVPRGSCAKVAAENVITQQLPQVRRLMEAGELQVDNIDVFCERGVFDVELSRKILLAGRKCGLALNFHGDELHPMKAAELGAELGACAVSHLEEISQEGIDAMAQVGSIGVILPTTAYILRLRPPDVANMIKSGMAVALGSDFNPNAFCLAMPIVMHLACVNLRMTLPQTLTATTLNAAAALGKSDTHGSLEKGKFGNMLLINAPRWEHLVYQLGCSESLIQYVVRRGEVVVENI